jgi:hypothetical protein
VASAVGVLSAVIAAGGGLGLVLAGPYASMTSLVVQSVPASQTGVASGISGATLRVDGGTIRNV